MRLIANSQLYNPEVYGTVATNQVFDVPDEIGKQLLSDGKARRPDPPKVIKETKVISPPEVGPVVPFRNLSVPHKKPKEVAEEGDNVLSMADIPKQGTTRAGRRRMLRGLHKGKK